MEEETDGSCDRGDVGECAARAAAIVVTKVDEAPAPNTHLVQRGETLFSISKRYGVAIEEIKVFNAMKTNHVQVGQHLLLNGFADAEAAPSLAPALIHVSAPARTILRKSPSYTVRSGDTLHAIANKFAVQIDDLLRWNKLHSKSVLQPGNKIRVTLL